MKKNISFDRPIAKFAGRSTTGRGFTLAEMLVVIAIIAVLAALILSALSRSKHVAKKTLCISNARQINLAVHMYVDDHADTILAVTNKDPIFWSYKESIQLYLIRNDAKTNDVLFNCPSDDFDCALAPIQEFFLFQNVRGKGFHSLKETYYSSYIYNGVAADEVETRTAGKRFSSMREPSHMILIGEISGAIALSTHDRQQPEQFNNAKSVMSFVDGHVSYIPIYWNGNTHVENMPALNNPPGGYEYIWF
jgi:prepilin-type N-terminal cleavage/methylation domain-containing protein